MTGNRASESSAAARAIASGPPPGRSKRTICGRSMSTSTGPEVARHVDLRRRRAAARLLDHPVQHLGDADRVAHLLLVADHVREEAHLRDLLEAALSDGPVRRLRRHQEQRRVVPVGGLDRRHEVGDARPVLGDAHRHLAGRPPVAVRHHPGVALVGAVPEGDAGARKEVRDRHERRADDAEGVLDAVPLQDLHEGLFGGHAHGRGLPSPSVAPNASWGRQAVNRQSPGAAGLEDLVARAGSCLEHGVTAGVASRTGRRGLTECVAADFVATEKLQETDGKPTPMSRG